MTLISCELSATDDTNGIAVDFTSLAIRVLSALSHKTLIVRSLASARSEVALTCFTNR